MRALLGDPCISDGPEVAGRGQFACRRLELPRAEPELGGLRRQALAQQPVADGEAARGIDPFGIGSTAHVHSLHRDMTALVARVEDQERVDPPSPKLLAPPSEA